MKHENNSNVCDITILGGGPTGLFAAFYAGLRNSSCKIIDSMPMLGGRLISVYPEKYIYDVAGFPKILAQDLVSNLVEQIKPYSQEICLNENAQTLTRTENGLWKITTNKQEHLTKTLIISAGVGSYSPKKHTGKNAQIFEGKGVSYAVLEKQAFKNKNVIIAGGGDSALDWANELTQIAKHVTLIHRTDSFRAHGDSVNKLYKTNARILLNTEILEFHGDSHLKSVTIKNSDTGEETSLPADDALVMFGYNSSLGKLNEWGLELVGNGILVSERMETNLPGIFAAGDIAKHSAKLDLIATGFSEAAIAVAFAKVFLNPKEKAQPMHSTTIMEIKEKQAKRKHAQE
ncbi:MAG: NAD(P)/FAD-dependent oxidoreductase [Bdellovibrionota bacterium]